MEKSLWILTAVLFLLSLNAALIEAENATTESYPSLNSTTLAAFISNSTEAVSVEPQDGPTQVNATTAATTSTKSPISTSAEKTVDVKKINKDSEETSKEEEDKDTKDDKTTKLGQ